MSVLDQKSKNIEIDTESVSRFCRKWHIAEMSLFGSVLRDDFGDDSDVDVLVSFELGSEPTLAKNREASSELSELFGRQVHLLSHGCLESWRMPPSTRENIQQTAEVIFALP